MFLMKKKWGLLAFAGVLFLSACKKDQAETSFTPPPTPPATGSAANAEKDSALAFSKDLYLWYRQIPATFNARSYENLNKVMTALRQYSIEPGFSAPVDRWSFAVSKSSWDNTASGISGDFGLSVFFRTENDLRVKSVEAASPAGRAGIRRGWKITGINGNTNITSANADFVVQQVWNSNSTSFTFQKPDGSSVTLQLQTALYQENPVILDTVYQINGKSIGYFAFNSFLGDTSRVYNDFARVFNGFASRGVQDLVVDLRYNGGGYVSMQHKLANWLAPLAANGQLMMKQEFNDKYSNYNSTDLFRKQGSLNLNRIFFIVSNSTASASELLINNLKPYMDVQLIGPSKTYGKPVGYFPVPVGNSYIFPVSFRSTNKSGEGNYFNGFALNRQAADGLDRDWGDVAESCLQSAINYITTGSYGPQSAAQRVVLQAQSGLIDENGVLDARRFKGAVDVRGIR